MASLGFPPVLQIKDFEEPATRRSKALLASAVTSYERLVERALSIFKFGDGTWDVHFHLDRDECETELDPILWDDGTWPKYLSENKITLYAHFVPRPTTSPNDEATPIPSSPLSEIATSAETSDRLCVSLSLVPKTLGMFSDRPLGGVEYLPRDSTSDDIKVIARAYTHRCLASSDKPEALFEFFDNIKHSIYVVLPEENELHSIDHISQSDLSAVSTIIIQIHLEVLVKGGEQPLQHFTDLITQTYGGMDAVLRGEKAWSISVGYVYIGEWDDNAAIATIQQSRKRMLISCAGFSSKGQPKLRSIKSINSAHFHRIKLRQEFSADEHDWWGVKVKVENRLGIPLSQRCRESRRRLQHEGRVFAR
ncbi:MAG: hypothetical protein M1821_008234 [Bathelium mastoideum]|nr:MAG: hypothetical protein M1821_008234 [Bathelium mastoideum]